MNESIPNVDNRQFGSEHVGAGSEDETLILDSRAALTPSQLVEQKLIGRLQSSALLVSQVQRRLKPGPR